MIRIFITALLYLISFFTQAQTNSNIKNHEFEIEKEQVIAESPDKTDSLRDFSPRHFDSQRNQATKFEVIDKDLTFEINNFIKQP